MQILFYDEACFILNRNLYSQTKIMVFQKYPEIFQVPSHEPQIPHNYRVTPYPTNMQQYNVHPTSFEFDELLDITSNQTNNSMKKKSLP
jgi:hypothetical protein